MRRRRSCRSGRRGTRAGRQECCGRCRHAAESIGCSGAREPHGSRKIVRASSRMATSAPSLACKRDAVSAHVGSHGGSRGLAHGQRRRRGRFPWNAPLPVPCPRRTLSAPSACAAVRTRRCGAPRRGLRASPVSQLHQLRQRSSEVVLDSPGVRLCVGRCVDEALLSALHVQDAGLDRQQPVARVQEAQEVRTHPRPRLVHHPLQHCAQTRAAVLHDRASQRGGKQQRTGREV
jgi:hypothetical protein